MFYNRWIRQTEFSLRPMMELICGGVEHIWPVPGVYVHRPIFEVWTKKGNFKNIVCPKK